MFEIPKDFDYANQEWGCPNELRAQYDKLSDELIPDMGKCETVNGELLRAANKICWDYFNNGWGCNNWSGAVIYLFRRLCLDQAVCDALSHVYGYSHGEPVADLEEQYTSGDIHAAACYVIMKAVLEAITANPAPVPNAVDMYDLTEPSYVYPEEDDDEDNE